MQGWVGGGGRGVHLHFLATVVISQTPMLMMVMAAVLLVSVLVLLVLCS